MILYPTTINKSELDKSVLIYHSVALPQHSHKWIYLWIHFACETNKGPSIFNQSEEAMSRVTASVMIFFRDMTTDFRGNGFSKKKPHL